MEGYTGLKRHENEYISRIIEKARREEDDIGRLLKLERLKKDLEDGIGLRKKRWEEVART